MTIKGTSLTHLVAGRPSPSFLRPSADFHELLRARGDDVIECCPTALSKLRLARILHHCGGRSKWQTQWVWRQASERLLLNRNNKIVSKGDDVSKINRGSGVLVVLRGLWRRGSVQEGRVQVRGGVRWPHALPSRVRSARGGGFL